jgi:peroxiredoxin
MNTVDTAESVEGLTRAAERRWVERWAAGPTEPEGTGLASGTPAPDLPVVDHDGRARTLSEFWADGPALVMFWRHFGCSCGAERATRLRAEWSQYRDAGLTPVIVSQGEPARAKAYREELDIPATVLSDPDHVVYRASGVGHWPVERVLYDAPAEYWSHETSVGAAFQADRRARGRAPVDDPWRAAAEVVVGIDGRVRLSYYYQHCEGYPDPRVLTTPALLSRPGGVRPPDEGVDPG